MSTPTETALARRWRLQIDMSAAQDGSDWQNYPGVTGFNWTASPNIEDDTEYDDEGWGGNTKTGQDWEVVVTANRKHTPDSTAYSPVHEKVRTAFFAYGAANKIHLRFFDRNGLPEAYEGKAIPDWEPQNDEARDLDQVQVTFTGDGPLTPITNPVTP